MITNNKAEKILPYQTVEAKGAQVERMFDSIAENYDTLNHTLSFGIDKGWRKKSILSLKNKSPQNILDIATGTGDLAIQAYTLLRPGKILGIDISEGMMDIARKKVTQQGLAPYISFEKQDCMALQIQDNSFDAAMVAFGVRNFEDLNKGLKEILRVLRPGGQLMILELTTPEKFPMKQAYKIYSKLVIPTIGRFISKDKIAYKYLPATIKAFVQGRQMADILSQTGFCNVQYKTYTFGICTMYLAEKTV